MFIHPLLTNFANYRLLLLTYDFRRTEPESVYIRERNEGNERRVNTESCQSQELFLERTSSGENLSTQESGIALKLYFV